MTQDPTIGVVTKADIREGLVVNRSLLKAAQGDIEYLGNRLAACDERIEFQHKLKAQWQELADLAPTRIERIKATIAHQEAQLATMRDEPTKSTPKAPLVDLARETRIAALLDRINKGDMTATTELAKLARSK